MAAKNIPAALSSVLRDDGCIIPASKAWLLLGVIFAAVSVRLFWGDADSFCATEETSARLGKRHTPRSDTQP